MAGPMNQQKQQTQRDLLHALGHQDAVRMREQLMRMETWELQDGKVDETLMTFGYQALAQREENQQLTQQAQQMFAPAQADAAAPGEPEQELVPAEKSDKQVKEEAKQAKRAQKVIPFGDHVSFALNRDVTAYYKEREAALKGKWREMARENGVDEEAIAGFLQGHASGVFAKNGDRDAADRAFVEAYLSGKLDQRRPYLQQFTEEVMNYQIDLSLFTDDYLAQHGREVLSMCEKMNALQRMMGDGVNAPFFQQELTEEQRELLAQRMTENAAFTSMLQNRMAAKGIALDGSYNTNYADMAEAVNDFEQRRSTVWQSGQGRREILQRHREARIQRRLDDMVQQEVEQGLKQNTHKKGYENMAGLGTSGVFAPLRSMRAICTLLPSRYAQFQTSIDMIYQQAFRTLDAAGEFVARASFLSHLAEKYRALAELNPEEDEAILVRQAEQKKRELQAQAFQLRRQAIDYAELVDFYMNMHVCNETVQRVAGELGLQQEVEQLAQERQTERRNEAPQQPEEAAEQMERKLADLRYEPIDNPPYDGTTDLDTLAMTRFKSADKARHNRNGVVEQGQPLVDKALKIVAPDGSVIEGVATRRLINFLSRKGPEQYTDEQLVEIVRKMTACSRYCTAKEQAANISLPQKTRERAQAELAAYTPEQIEQMQTTFWQGMTELKKIYLHCMRAVVQKYGRYLGQLHPIDLITRMPDVMSDLGNMGDIYELVKGHEKFLDCENNPDDMELAQLAQYLFGAQQKLRLFFDSDRRAMHDDRTWGDYFRMVNWGCWVGTKYGGTMLPDDVPGFTEAEQQAYKQSLHDRFPELDSSMLA